MATGAKITVEFEDPATAGTFLKISGLEKAPDISSQRGVADVTGIGDTDEWEFDLIESDAPDYDLVFPENPDDATLNKLIAAATAANGTVLNMRHTYIAGKVSATFKVHFYETSLPGVGRKDNLKRTVRGKMKTIEPVWGA